MLILRNPLLIQFRCTTSQSEIALRYFFLIGKYPGENWLFRKMFCRSFIATRRFKYGRNIEAVLSNSVFGPLVLGREMLVCWQNRCASTFSILFKPFSSLRVAIAAPPAVSCEFTKFILTDQQLYNFEKELYTPIKVLRMTNFKRRLLFRNTDIEEQEMKKNINNLLIDIGILKWNKIMI